jgi:hypothetical protein
MTLVVFLSLVTVADCVPRGRRQRPASHTPLISSWVLHPVLWREGLSNLPVHPEDLDGSIGARISPRDLVQPYLYLGTCYAHTGN